MNATLLVEKCRELYAVVFQKLNYIYHLLLVVNISTKYTHSFEIEKCFILPYCPVLYSSFRDIIYYYFFN